MRIAFALNLKRKDVEAQQEFDAPKHALTMYRTLRRLGHTVLDCEVSGPVKTWLPRMLKFKPDLVFNIAEGSNGRAREAQFPIIYEAYDLPYTGSDAHALMVTLDKWLTKRSLEHVVHFERPYHLITEPKLPTHTPGVFILKPNFEGSSKGITDDSVGRPVDLQSHAHKLLRKYPDGLIMEPFIEGYDLTVPWLEGHGALSPMRVVQTTRTRSPHNVYGYKQKGRLCDGTQLQFCEHLGARAITETIAKRFGLRGCARVDFRSRGGDLHFLEVNALPSLEHKGALALAAANAGLTYDDVFRSIVESATRRVW